ncbi:MAG: hypothetical protein R3E58_12620 [Phycisphaerae bacterium]
MSGVRDIAIFDASPFGRIGGECRDYRKTIMTASRQSHRPFCRSPSSRREAAKSAGFDASHTAAIRGDSASSWVPGIGGCSNSNSAHLRLVNKGPDRISAFTIPRS